MNLCERMNHIRSRAVDADELQRQIEWQADYYQAILAEPGNELPMSRADCEALARADAAPTEMEIMRAALHEELVGRLEIDVAMAIVAEPAGDVVPVVRCADCGLDLGTDKLFIAAYTCPMFGKPRHGHVGPCASFVAKPLPF
jgi:hypothetical protein